MATVAECPECQAAIDLSGPVEGDLVACPGCGAELEIVNLDPPGLTLAPGSEEDWGE